MTKTGMRLQTNMFTTMFAKIGKNETISLDVPVEPLQYS